MNLCINCKFYQAGADEVSDICLHPKAAYGGVRQVKQTYCYVMRTELCFNAALFEPAVPVVLEQAVGVELPNLNVVAPNA